MIMDNFRNFIYWEAASRDTIDFKKTYVDMTDDLLAGLLLSQIIYWYLPNKTGDSKLRVKKEGIYWIAKSHDEWYEEIRFSRRNFDTAIKKLVQLNLIEKQIFRFSGTPTIHIRLIEENFFELWTSTIEKSKNKGREKQEEPAPTLDLYESHKSEEPAPTLDLYESHKSICTNRTNPFVRNDQIINIENYKEDFKEKREEEDEYILASFSNYKTVFNFFKKQNHGKSITIIQHKFLESLKKYKIDENMGSRIIEEIGDLNLYNIDAINNTFKKSIVRVRSNGIMNLPRWFKTTLQNEDFQVQQSEIERREIEETNRKVGIRSGNGKNPAKLADPAGFNR